MTDQAMHHEWRLDQLIEPPPKRNHRGECLALRSGRLPARERPRRVRRCRVLRARHEINARFGGWVFGEMV